MVIGCYNSLYYRTSRNRKASHSAFCESKLPTIIGFAVKCWPVLQYGHDDGSFFLLSVLIFYYIAYQRQRTKLIVRGKLLAACARVMCVRAVIVDVRLPSPRAHSRKIYITEKFGEIIIL